MHSDKNFNERMKGKAHSAQEPECIELYMRIPSTVQRRHSFAQ